MRLALKLFVYVTADGWTNVIQRAGDKGQDISIYSECRPACPALRTHPQTHAVHIVRASADLPGLPSVPWEMLMATLRPGYCVAPPRQIVFIFIGNFICTNLFIGVIVQVPPPPLFRHMSCG